MAGYRKLGRTSSQRKQCYKAWYALLFNESLQGKSKVKIAEVNDHLAVKRKITSETVKLPLR